MRPKKPILLYCSDPELLSTVAFALRLRPYQVIATYESSTAVTMCTKRNSNVVCGVLVHAEQGDPAGRLVHRLLESGATIPLLLIDRVGDLAPVRYADIVLYGRNTTTAHVFASLEILCRRRRGSGPWSAA